MSESLDQLYKELYTRVVEDDMSSQEYYLSMVAEQRKIPISYLLQLGALFIPNNDYITHYLGDKALTSSAGLYYNGSCPWCLFMVLPIRNLAGEVKGLVGWDAYNKYRELSEGVQGLVSYRVSAKSVFERERYFLSDIDCLKVNFSKRVIFITDGVFDALALSYRELPSIALLGSSFSREVIYFLSWYHNIYVCTDNDSAGLNLYRKLARALQNVCRVTQNQTKDVEEFLRNDGFGGPRTMQLRKLVDNPTNSDYMLKV